MTVKYTNMNPEKYTNINPDAPLSEREIQEHLKTTRESSELTKLTSELFFQEREELEGLINRLQFALDQFRYEVSQSREKIDNFSDAKTIREQEKSALSTLTDLLDRFTKEHGLTVRVDWKTMSSQDILKAIEQAYRAKLHEIENPV